MDWQEAGRREGWPQGEVERIEQALSDLGLGFEERDQGIGVVGAFEVDAYESLDTAQPQPVRMAVWKLIERERQRAQKREDQAARSRAASEDLKRRFDPRA